MNTRRAQHHSKGVNVLPANIWDETTPEKEKNRKPQCLRKLMMLREFSILVYDLISASVLQKNSPEVLEATQKMDSV